MAVGVDHAVVVEDVVGVDEVAKGGCEGVVSSGG